MVLLIDNYDSFSYNLYQMIGEIEPDIKVIRNDELTIDEIRSLKPDRLIISPGPGRPEDAGIIVEAAKELGKEIPTLGVCLGHQAIGEVFGASLENLKEVYHGVQTEGTQLGNDYIFEGLPERVMMGRYHSWVVAKDSVPECLEVTAMSDDGEIMAMRHRQYDIHGIQFHPESVLTPEGKTIVGNFLKH